MCQRSVGKATNSVGRTASERAADQQKALHSGAQLHGQEPKQQLADVPKKRREGNELRRPNSIRMRGKSAQRRCTAERSCTDKNQNSNWQMYQRGVGMATKSVSRAASERGKSAQSKVQFYKKANRAKNG